GRRCPSPKRGAGGGVLLASEFREVAGAEAGVVAGEPALPDDADAEAGVVSRVVVAVGDRPSPEYSAAENGRCASELDTGVVARLADGGASEVESRARRTRETSEGNAGRGEAAAARGNG